MMKNETKNEQTNRSSEINERILKIIVGKI